MQGLVELGTLDEGRISRNLCHQERRWGECLKCERCGALGHEATICREPNDFPGACRTCVEYGHKSRQCRIASNHADVIAAVPPAMQCRPSAFAEGAAMGAERAAWQEQLEKNQSQM